MNIFEFYVQGTSEFNFGNRSGQAAAQSGISFPWRFMIKRRYIARYMDVAAHLVQVARK
jgi:hypothetical protein